MGVAQLGSHRCRPPTLCGKVQSRGPVPLNEVAWGSVWSVEDIGTVWPEF